MDSWLNQFRIDPQYKDLIDRYIPDEIQVETARDIVAAPCRTIPPPLVPSALPKNPRIPEISEQKL